MIQVRRHGDSQRYEAEVLFVSHAADLAILTVEDPAFFDGIEPLELGALPETKSSVAVYGFPMGGDVLSVTKGIISRVEHQTYTHSGFPLLAIQIDAAINPGNSGGPAVADGQVVGIAVQGNDSAENMGYIIAPPVIQQFLTDIEDGKRQGIPGLGFKFQRMENPGMRAYYGMTKKQSGILIGNVSRGSSCAGILKKGDVFLAIDGHSIANDGTVEFRPGERTLFAYYVDSHQVGDSVTFSILRDKKPMALSVTLNSSIEETLLVARNQYDIAPTYYVYGGLVFAPFTMDLLYTLGSFENYSWAISLLPYMDRGIPDDLDEVVVMQRVLAAGVNEGYHDEFFLHIETVNGQKVRSLRHMIQLVEAGEGDDYVVFGASTGEKIILDRNAVKKAAPKILKAYQVPKDRSDDLIKSVGE